MLFREHKAGRGEVQVIEEFFIEANSQLVDPTLRRFDSVWRSKVVDGEPPARDDIDPLEVTELLPHIMLADIRLGEKGAEIQPRLVGQHHLALGGRVPGRGLEGAGENGALASVMLDEIVERRQPHYSMLRAAAGGKGSLEAARAVYPLSSDGVTVDRIVSVIVPYYPPGALSIDTFIRR